VKIACPVCGEMFNPAGSNGRPRRYCSAACRTAIARRALTLCSQIGYANCSECGELFIVRMRRAESALERHACRKPDCRRSQKNRQQREFFRRYRAENGEAYTIRYHEKRKAAMRQYLNRKMALPYEEFTDAEIFERDEWVCQLCHLPVDPDLKWPDPLSKSLDHIVPLAAGGHHLRSNCQLAHVTCNVRKGAKVAC
jgi:5-methylcytosine-specific restriction endonuclease McrA